MKHAAVTIFALAAALQWILPLAGVWEQERVLARGTTWRVRCTAPDPYDPFRGRFLRVRPEESEAPVPAGMPAESRVPVWARLVEGDGGVSRIASLSLEPLAGDDVIRLTASHYRFKPGTVVLDWPFDRFYLTERLAPEADRLVAKALRGEERPVAEFRLHGGHAVLVDVLVGGERVRELVARAARAKAE